MDAKKIKIALAILVASGLSACEPADDGGDEATPMSEYTTKDVYKTLDECMQDWGDKQMCTQAAQAQADVAKAQAAAAQAQVGVAGGGHPVIMPMFFGPEYTIGERRALVGNSVYTPRGQHAYRTTPSLKPSAGFLTSRNNFVRANPALAAKMMPKSYAFSPTGRTAISSARSAARGGGSTFSGSSGRSVARGSFGGTGRAFGGFSGG